MFNSTVRKCSETPACVRVASGLLPIVLALAATQLAYPQSQPIATILQGQLLTTKGVPVAGATVQWSFVGAPNPSQTGASDSAGNFAFEIPLATPTQVQLATNANLYTPTQTSAISAISSAGTSLRNHEGVDRSCSPPPKRRRYFAHVRISRFRARVIPM